MARLPIITILTALGLACPIDISGLRHAEARDYLQFASASCGSAASRVLRETGGQLLSAAPSSDGRVCEVTVLVQEKGSERPRKVTVRVPI